MLRWWYPQPNQPPPTNPILVLASDGNRFWDEEYFNPRGFTRVSGGEPILSMNCHGYSTGVGYWLDDFFVLMEHDYGTIFSNITSPGARYFYGRDLADGAVYSYGDPGNNDHSGKIDSVTTEVVAGEMMYIVVSISEKNRESAIYRKTVNLPFGGDDTVVIEGNTGFYKKL